MAKAIDVAGNFTIYSWAIGGFKQNMINASAAGVSMQGSVQTAARATQMYNVMKPSTALQADVESLMVYQLVYMATAGHQNKLNAVEMINRVAQVSIKMLDEVYGLRNTRVNLPDADQWAALKTAIASARTTNSLT